MTWVYDVRKNHLHTMVCINLVHSMQAHQVIQTILITSV